jgi:hypothetical protein
MHFTPKEKRWLRRTAVAFFVVLVVVGADVLKSTFLCEIIARKLGAKRTHIREVTFDGLWRITLDADIPGSVGSVRYSVTPILPVVFR